jgi:hypothetical protein
LVHITSNGQPVSIATIEDLGNFLDRLDQEPRFELWVSVPDGPSMSMLRNGPHAWLMYLRFNGDAGFVSRGDATRTGSADYTLSNGQVDEYPLSWCIDLELCYQAISYFFANEGDQPAWIAWKE